MRAPVPLLWFDEILRKGSNSRYTRRHCFFSTSPETPAGNSNVFVSVSHPTAGNSPVVSNTVVLGVVLARSILNFESLSASSSTAILSNVNLATVGAFVYNVSTFGNPILCFYAPEKDVNLELEIFASKGLDSGGGVGTKPVYGNVYTGDKMKGIGTLHKSNAVPIFTDEEAVDQANMRR